MQNSQRGKKSTHRREEGRKGAKRGGPGSSRGKAGTSKSGRSQDRQKEGGESRSLTPRLQSGERGGQKPGEDRQRPKEHKKGKGASSPSKRKPGNPKGRKNQRKSGKPKTSRHPAPPQEPGMEPVEFWSICAANSLPLTNDQMDLFLRYAEDLYYWNDQINLISRRDMEHLWLRHLLHSLTPVLMGLIPESGRILDIGSGGGLPGIPIKIARPKLDITLVDSIAKKVRTTSMLASHLVKGGLQTIRIRAEELANDPEHTNAYDVVIARAVAPLVDLMTWAEPLLKNDGKIVALKGGALTDEVDHARNKFPEASIDIQDIELHGVDWFAKENKRIVVVKMAK